jgi:hypothetical protein
MIPTSRDVTIKVQTKAPAFASFSLILFLLTAIALVLSFYRTDVLGAERESSPLFAQSRGSILIGIGSLLDGNSSMHHIAEYFKGQNIWNIAWGYIYGDELDDVWGTAGFYFARTQPNAAIQDWCIIFPHWVILLLTSIAPSIFIFRRRRSTVRKSKNLCPHCGYDLRATPQRCPECGRMRMAAD